MKLIIFLISYFLFLFFAVPIHAQTSSFTFIGITDTNSNYTNTRNISTKALALNPAFIIFSGDTDNYAASSSTMSTWLASVDVIKNMLFPVRGNHDNSLSGSLSAWNSALSVSSVYPQVGATNFSSLSGYDDAVYSFDYQNSHFVGLDDPGNVYDLTSNIVTWLDTDLAAAKTRGLTHAFIFFHGPIYCMGGDHCAYSTKSEYYTHTVMQQLYTVINKHPIITATFHGHEHHFSYTRIDSSRIAPITHPFYQFAMGSLSTYRSCNANRCDYTYPSSSSSTYGMTRVMVNQATITVDWLVSGNTPPAHSFSFTKAGVPTLTPTPLKTPTPTLSPTPPSGNTVILTPVADADVSAGTPDTNHGTATTLTLDGSPVVRSYLSFDLTALGTASITSAVLALTTTGVDGAQSPAAVTIYPLTSPTAWSETGITYTNAPALGTTALGSFIPAALSTTYTTPLPLPLTSSALTLVLTTQSTNGAEFSSREGTHPPTLTLTLSGPPANPYDYDHDGDVDFLDLKAFLPQFTGIFDYNELLSWL